MKRKLILIPVIAATGFASYVAFHPGVAYAEPRMLSGKPTKMADTATYSIDPMHAGVSFEITHLGLSKVHGRINKFSGKIVEHAKDINKCSVEFKGDVSSIDTAVAARDEHLKNADFFDVPKFPEITFKSTKVAKAKDGYVVTGDLTIKDKTKKITIPFKHYGPLTLKGMGDQGTRIGVVCDPIVIKRSDFGVGSTAPLPDGTIGASDEVTLRISLEATLDK